MATHIQWTDEVWNPVTGCTKVSPGCAHCYAERLAPRVFAGQTVEEVVNQLSPGAALTRDRPRRFTDVRCHPERLDAPLRWRKPRRIFVNSMSDLFHEDVPDDFIERVFEVMCMAEQHTFQILTKRPERMRKFMCSWVGEGHTWGRNAPPRVWLGVSVEDQRRADERIPILLDTPATVRFLSCEPLLGPVDLAGPGFLRVDGCHTTADGETFASLCTCRGKGSPAVDWIIVGGESGPKARPMDLAWARSLVEQGRAAGVPVFVKQLGARPYVVEAGIGDWLVRHRAGGDPDEWPADLRVREFPGG